MNIILVILVNAAAVMLGAYLLTGVKIADFTRAIILAVILALLNATLGAVLDLITTPIRWLTLGLFSLVVDAVVIKIADYFMKGFEVKSFGWAFLLALILAVVNNIVHF